MGKRVDGLAANTVHLEFLLHDERENKSRNSATGLLGTRSLHYFQRHVSKRHAVEFVLIFGPFASASVMLPALENVECVVSYSNIFII